jgi:hypothetical protein
MLKYIAAQESLIAQLIQGLLEHRQASQDQVRTLVRRGMHQCHADQVQGRGRCPAGKRQIGKNLAFGEQPMRKQRGQNLGVHA